MFTDFYPLSTYAWVFLSVEITIMESLKRQEDIHVSTFPSSQKRNVLWVDGDDVLINNHSCIYRERSSKVLGSPSLTTSVFSEYSRVWQWVTKENGRQNPSTQRPGFKVNYPPPGELKLQETARTKSFWDEGPLTFCPKSKLRKKIKTRWKERQVNGHRAQGTRRKNNTILSTLLPYGTRVCLS